MIDPDYKKIFAYFVCFILGYMLIKLSDTNNGFSIGFTNVKCITGIDSSSANYNKMMQRCSTKSTPAECHGPCQWENQSSPPTSCANEKCGKITSCYSKNDANDCSIINKPSQMWNKLDIKFGDKFSINSANSNDNKNITVYSITQTEKGNFYIGFELCPNNMPKHITQTCYSSSDEYYNDIVLNTTGRLTKEKEGVYPYTNPENYYILIWPDKTHSKERYGYTQFDSDLDLIDNYTIMNRNDNKTTYKINFVNDDMDKCRVQDNNISWQLIYAPKNFKELCRNNSITYDFENNTLNYEELDIDLWTVWYGSSKKNIYTILSDHIPTRKYDKNYPYRLPLIVKTYYMMMDKELIATSFNTDIIHYESSIGKRTVCESS